MLSNAYFLAKFRFDTPENEPAKNLQNFAKFARILLILLILSQGGHQSLAGFAHSDVAGRAGERGAGGPGSWPGSDGPGSGRPDSGGPGWRESDDGSEQELPNPAGQL